VSPRSRLCRAHLGAPPLGGRQQSALSTEGPEARSSDEGSLVERIRVWRHEALRLPPREGWLLAAGAVLTVAVAILLANKSIDLALLMPTLVGVAAMIRRRRRLLNLSFLLALFFTIASWSPQPRRDVYWPNALLVGVAWFTTLVSLRWLARRQWKTSALCAIQNSWRERADSSPTTRGVLVMIDDDGSTSIRWEFVQGTESLELVERWEADPCQLRADDGRVFALEVEGVYPPWLADSWEASLQKLDSTGTMILKDGTRIEVWGSKSMPTATHTERQRTGLRECFVDGSGGFDR